MGDVAAVSWDSLTIPAGLRVSGSRRSLTASPTQDRATGNAPLETQEAATSGAQPSSETLEEPKDAVPLPASADSDETQETHNPVIAIHGDNSTDEPTSIHNPSGNDRGTNNPMNLRIWTHEDIQQISALDESMHIRATPEPSHLPQATPTENGIDAITAETADASITSETQNPDIHAQDQQHSSAPPEDTVYADDFLTDSDIHTDELQAHRPEAKSASDTATGAADIILPTSGLGPLPMVVEEQGTDIALTEESNQINAEPHDEHSLCTDEHH